VSQDSERTVSEVGVEEMVTQVEQATVESPHPKAVVIMVEKPAAEAAGGSTMQDTTLVVVSTSLSCPPLAGQSSDNQRMEDNVVLEFDATHCLSKPTTAWEGEGSRWQTIGGGE
jgi:hypothetical protein